MLTFAQASEGVAWRFRSVPTLLFQGECTLTEAFEKNGCGMMPYLFLRLGEIKLILGIPSIHLC